VRETKKESEETRNEEIKKERTDDVTVAAYLLFAKIKTTMKEIC
jgi:hypothetical protein